MSIQCFLCISWFVIVAAQEIRDVYPNSGNYTGEIENFGNLENGQSHLWLLSRDGPVPVGLNRDWSPESGYPGVQTVTSQQRGAYGYRLRGSQTPVEVLQGLTDQTRESNGDFLVFSQENSNSNTNPNLERTFLNLQDPESVLVELPIELASGFWESPRPNIIQELSTGRSISARVDPSALQLGAVNGEQDQYQAFIPNREGTSRLPVTTSENTSEVATQNVQSLGIASHPVSSSLESNYTASVQSASREYARLPANGRKASGNSGDVVGSNNQQLYQISYEAPTQTQNNVGLTLTPEDIEILERLGILSSLNLEGVESSNNSEISSDVDSQREYENDPILLDNVGQVYNFLPEGRYDTNISDVVFIEFPEFSTSRFHGNIPTNSDVENVHPVPFVISNSLANADNRLQNNNESADAPVFNGTSLTSEQIKEILKFLGLNNPLPTNKTSIQEDTLPMPKENETIVDSGTVAQDLETPTKISNVSDAQFKLSNESFDASSSAKSHQENAISNREYTDDSHLGLVRSGRIQPRVLEKAENQASVRENEVQLLSPRVSPESSRKSDILRKLIEKPKPYAFGFQQSDVNGIIQYRDESADATGSVKGSYGYRDALGVYRNVNYIADDNGYHAVVRTNEPGTISHNPADTVIVAELPPQAAVAQMLAYLRRNSSISSSV
ncbi:hypothetical protein JTE90_004229 [Oedothorax gibbosus]|uniref:Cuticle protein 6 n=1 Tax=Oedothorax gibbosus TaxID=931172 RepID=A0AAV6URB1_9ARAC|nr:hypothetical protein JTE90_004229 [Oedothorax gibbosus]